MIVVSAVLIGVLYAFLNSFVREPHRRRFNAIMVGGAGAAYLSGGGLGVWEFAFTIVVTYARSAAWSRGRSSASPGSCTRRGTWSTT